MPGDLNLPRLRAFVAVAQEQHFTHAARKLNMTQQAVSSQIRGLEAQLNVTLFDRTTRNVELTEAGRTLMDHAVPLLAAASRAWEDVTRAGAGNTGSVVVAYPPTARKLVLPRILHRFHSSYPAVEVHTCEAWWGAETIIARMADVAITRGTAVTESDLKYASLSESALGFVLGKCHTLAGREAVGVADLGDEALVIPARMFSPGFFDAIVGSLRSRGFSGPIHEFENIGPSFLLDDQVACDEVASGRAVGIGFVQQYENLPHHLTWRRIKPTLGVPLLIYWRRDAGQSVKNFVSVARAVARAMRSSSLEGPGLEGA